MGGCVDAFAKVTYLALDRGGAIRSDEVGRYAIRSF